MRILAGILVIILSLSGISSSDGGLNPIPFCFGDYFAYSGYGYQMPEPCLDYDSSDDGIIELDEAVSAVIDYFDYKIDLGTVITVINCYFSNEYSI